MAKCCLMAGGFPVNIFFCLSFCYECCFFFKMLFSRKEKARPFFFHAKII